jgi:hypothetical protein
VLHQRMSEAAVQEVAPYSFENAAFGMADAAREAVLGRSCAEPLSGFKRR